ncbi:MAG TPA: hypothetical protein VGM25_12345 [Caulobacteraceae bacterium]|jgi:hypothetical protein
MTQSQSRALTSSTPALPQRANIEHLKKQAKARLAELRRDRPDATLADAQLEIARSLGFPSWRTLKSAFDQRSADGEGAVGDWIGCPEGGVPVALHIRREGERLRAQFDVPSLGYFGDPAENLSVVDGRMTFQITTRGVNALYEGRWDPEEGAWTGVFTHDGRPMPLALRRGVHRAPRVQGLDGLWDASIEDGATLTFRIVTDDKGTFAWLNHSAVPGQWFQAARIARSGSEVALEMRTLRVQGVLAEDEARIEGVIHRQEGSAAICFLRRKPGAPAPKAEA